MTLKHTLSLLTVVAACGGSSPGTKTPLSNTSTVNGLPAAYASLFVATELEFPATFVTSTLGDNNEPERTEAKGTVKCVISDVRDVAGGKAMTLGCTSDLEFPDNPSGTFVGTSDGLWRLDEGADPTKLDPGQRLLPAIPAAARVEHKGPDGDVDSGEAIIVEPHAGGWCVMHAIYGGDEGGYALCVRDGALVGGHGFFAGGSSRDLFFGDVKRP